MKANSLLFFLFFYLYSFAQDLNATNDFSPNVWDTIHPIGQYVLLKSGEVFKVKQPVLVLENEVIFTLRGTKTTLVKQVGEVAVISRSCSPRWITEEKFEIIGKYPVFGNLMSINVLFPPLMGPFIMSDMVKRRRIKRMYRRMHVNLNK